MTNRKIFLFLCVNFFLSNNLLSSDKIEEIEIANNDDAVKQFQDNKRNKAKSAFEAALSEFDKHTVDKTGKKDLQALIRFYLGRISYEKKEYEKAAQYFWEVDDHTYIYSLEKRRIGRFISNAQWTKELKKAVTHSQIHLGIMHYHGQGVKKNISRAREFFIEVQENSSEEVSLYLLKIDHPYLDKMVRLIEALF